MNSTMRLSALGPMGRRVCLAAIFVLIGPLGCNKKTASGTQSAPAEGSGSPQAGASAASKAATGPSVEVHITASKKGFQPALVKLKKGRPGVLIFERTDDSECANAVKLPFLKETVDLPQGKKVRVEVPTGDDGTFRYSCWMRMLFGRVVIEP